MDELWSRLAAMRARLEATAFAQRAQRWRARLLRSWQRGTDPLRPAVAAASAVARRAESAVKPGNPPILYADGMVTLDRHGVVLSRYYLPFGRRRIRYDDIRRISEYPLTQGRQFRVHGFGWPRQWYQRDRHRGERAVGLELVTDDLLHPVLTPVDVDAVKEIIVERIAAARRASERDAR